MIEVLDDLDVLYQPHLDLTTIEVGGVALGTPGVGVPRESLVEAQSPWSPCIAVGPTSTAGATTPTGGG
ncbi:hypothetical protein ACIQRK_17700 [Streptomyces anulatus]